MFRAIADVSHVCLGLICAISLFSRQIAAEEAIVAVGWDVVARKDLDFTFRELRRTGQLAQILAAYGLTDWADND